MNDLESQNLASEETTLENMADNSPKFEETASSDVCALSENQPEEPVVATDDTPAPEETDESNVVPQLDYHHMTKEELVAELEQIVASGNAEAHKSVATIKQVFYVHRNKEVEAELAAFLEAGNPADAFASRLDENEEKMKMLLQQFKELRQAFLTAEEERRKENLDKKTALLDELKAIVEDIDNINLHFPKFQQLQQEFKAIKEIPQGAETDIWKTYQIVVEQFYDRLKLNKELRDLDFKKNYELKSAILAEAKSLGEEADVIAAFRKLQTLHEAWREIGPVAREDRERIWDEFKAASTVVRKRHQDFFEKRKAEEAANEEAKTGLCEEAEKIVSAKYNNVSGWENATKQLIELQTKWKEYGFTSRKTNNALFSRFRRACDEFFSAKSVFYKTMREGHAANLAKKVALCEQAEALQQTDDLRVALQKVTELQAEWRTIGPVARKQSEAVWERFLKACNYFRNQRRKQISGQKKEENENLAAKREVIAALKGLDASLKPSEAASVLKSLQEKWRSIGYVPFKVKDELQEAYKAALDDVYKTFDIRMGRSHGNDNYSKSEIIVGGKERDRLRRAYEQKKAELQTYENNMGFFSAKSKAGSAMMEAMEKSIAKIRTELDDIKSKMDALDAETEQ